MNWIECIHLQGKGGVGTVDSDTSVDAWLSFSSVILEEVGEVGLVVVLCDVVTIVDFGGASAVVSSGLPFASGSLYRR